MPETGDHRLGGLTLDLPDDLVQAFNVVQSLKDQGLAVEVYVTGVGWILA